jgi:hypothetical protein
VGGIHIAFVFVFSCRQGIELMENEKEASDRFLQAPDITAPLNGTETTGVALYIGGTSVAGGVISVFASGERVIAEELVNSDGSWGWHLTSRLSQGRKVIDAEVTVDGQTSQRTNPPVSIYVMYVPKVDEPREGSTQAQAFFVNGTDGYYSPSTRIEVFRDLSVEKLGEGTVMPDGSWSVRLVLSQGEHTIAVRQTSTADGVTSQRSAPRWFKVE